MTHMPNLFVIGAMKSATTSLCAYLGQHPDIYMALEKEPFYFVEGVDQVAESALPIRPDRNGQPWRMGSGEFATRAAYLSLFKAGTNHAYRAEGTPLYLPDPEAAARIYAASPNAKLIAVLRNPTARAYSAYTFQRSFDREPASTFADALRDELDGKRDGWWYGWRHIYTGRYAQQLRRYRELFGADKMLVLRQEELRDAPLTCLSRIFAFLDVTSEVEIDLSRQSNVTRQRPPLVRAAYRRLYANNPLKQVLKKVLPMTLRKAGNRQVRKVVEGMGTMPEPIRQEDRDFLADLYAPEIRDLEDLLGWEPTGWS